MASATKKTMFLHIGLHKTGTTAIQVDLSSNRETLAENGILYPRTGSPEGRHSFAQHRIAWQLNREPMATLKPWRLFQELEEEIDRFPGDKVVLSSEDFSLIENKAKIEHFAQLLKERMNVKIICFLRRQDDYLQSLYSTAVQLGDGRGINQLTELGRLNYERTLALWETAFGLPNIIIRPYELEVKADSTAEFLSIIGYRHMKLAFRKKNSRQNASLPGHILRVLAYLNWNKADPNVRKMLISIGGITTVRFPDDELLTAKDRESIMREHSESNANVARKYLGKSDGVLFVDGKWRGKDSPPRYQSSNDICSLIESFHTTMIQMKKQVETTK